MASFLRQTYPNKELVVFNDCKDVVQDEIIFQKVLLKTPLRDTISTDEVHYIDRSTDGPKTLHLRDFDGLMKSNKRKQGR